MNRRLSNLLIEFFSNANNAITNLSPNKDIQNQEFKEAEEKRINLRNELKKEANERRHESQSQYDKYLISLSSASLGFSVAFIKDSKFLNQNYKEIIIVSWVCFVISIIITLISFKTSVRAYQKQMEDIDNIFEGKTIYETMNSSNKYTKFFNKINLYIFLVGIFLTFVYICSNIKEGDNNMPEEKKSTSQEQIQSDNLSDELTTNEKLEIIKKGLVANPLPIENLKPIEKPESNVKKDE